MLTAQKRKFADALLSGEKQCKAAVIAGYSENSARSKGSQLAKDKDVINYMKAKKAETSKNEKSENPKLKKYEDPIEKLLDIMNFDEDPKLQVDAAKALLPYFHTKQGESTKKETKQSKAANAAKGKFSPATPPGFMN